MDDVPALSGAYYAQSFGVYRDAIDSEAAVRQRSAHLKEKLPGLLPQVGTGIRVLCVGAGGADISVLKRVVLPLTDIISVDAVEPSLEQIRFLKQSVEEAGLDKIVSIHHSTFQAFDKQFQGNPTYDLVVCFHVLYFLPLDTLGNLITNYLHPEHGLLVVAHSSPAGMGGLVRALGINSPQALLLVDAINLFQELQDHVPIEIQTVYLEKWIDVRECFVDGSEKGVDLLGFFVGKDLRKAERNLVEQLRRQVDIHKTAMRNGRKLLWHPECIALIKRK